MADTIAAQKNTDTTPELPKNATLREIIRFYLIDCATMPGKIIDIAIIALNIVVCLIFVAYTYPLANDTRHILKITESGIVIFFMVEYVVRLYGARNRIRHVFKVYSIIDFIAILPELIEWLFPALTPNMNFIRALRVFRIFRFLRYMADPHFFFGSITRQLLRVVQLVTYTFMIFFISSGLFWTVEQPINENVSTFGDAFYFTVVSLTTVGFGDIVPVSEAGRWITVVMILSGIIVIPWEASQIIKEWMRMSNKRQVTCTGCGLQYHDMDASHCKSCGDRIYQEYSGD